MALERIEAEEAEHQRDVAESGDGIVIESGRDMEDEPEVPEDVLVDDGD